MNVIGFPAVAFILGILIILIFYKTFAFSFKLLIKLLYNGFIGGIALLALNFCGGYIGIHIALNFVTCLIAGFLGVPGIALLLLLQYVFKV